jgi:repressor LexA
LSERAKCIYGYLERYIAEHGHAPTYRQIATACGISSTGSVNYWLGKLKDAGLIAFEPGAARTIVILEVAGGEES